MQSEAKTVAQYLESLSPERREAISTVRELILNNLPAGYVETMQYGMIGYVVPLKVYPAGYLNNKKVPLTYVALASQKNHMAVYLTNIYSDKATEEWFFAAYKATGKRMDLGKSCVRFSKLENLPLELIGQTVAKTPIDEFIALYEKTRRR